ncbi:uncharacterized protein LOC111040752 [Myzus persicae]|uniref:uncharacterized protein LOC111040752 n=1 Tax=Myzus persicae TaxID=13164 RepID=UPI000B936A69|nr:uncharacterized protein LOC111040752 [Myzus persicae]
MINQIMYDERSCYKHWYKFVNKMHDVLADAESVNVVFLVGFYCSICSTYVIEMRTKPCHHLTCRRCMSAEYCSKECSSTFIKTFGYLKLRDILSKDKYIFNTSDVVVSIKITTDGELLLNTYYRRKNFQVPSDFLYTLRHEHTPAIL